MVVVVVEVAAAAVADDPKEGLQVFLSAEVLLFDALISGRISMVLTMMELLYPTVAILRELTIVGVEQSLVSEVVMNIENSM